MFLGGVSRRRSHLVIIYHIIFFTQLFILIPMYLAWGLGGWVASSSPVSTVWSVDRLLEERQFTSLPQLELEQTQ